MIINNYSTNIDIIMKINTLKHKKLILVQTFNTYTLITNKKKGYPTLVR